MTPEELHALTAPDRAFRRIADVHLPVVQSQVRLILAVGEDERVSPTAAAALTDILALDLEHRDTLVARVLGHCRQCCIDIDYDHPVEDGETITEANHRAFGLAPDGAMPEGWFRPGWLKSIVVSNERTIPVYLDFNIPWEDEHGLQVVLTDGTLREVRL